jgi:hypothetical protein
VTWIRVSRGDSRALELASRHYTFKGPRRVLGAPAQTAVLLHTQATALFMAQWPYYARHAWAGRWECSLFRNETPEYRSSELIMAAMNQMIEIWGPCPGWVTFVNQSRVRKKRDPGRCFRKAGFVPAGFSGNGLLVLTYEGTVGPRPIPDIPRKPKQLTRKQMIEQGYLLPDG